MWPDAPANALGWDSWLLDLTTGGGDGWGGLVDQRGFIGFRQDDGGEL